ncbi:uncharacterized protein LOC120333090 [Styela clava]
MAYNTSRISDIQVQVVDFQFLALFAQIITAEMIPSVKFLVVFWALSQATGQREQSVPFHTSKDSCNVINVQCGKSQFDETSNEESQSRGPQGPPGKLGPRGPHGSGGDKGQKGEVGMKGEPAPDVRSSFITDLMFEILRVTSCRQLETEFGITQSGFYVMKSPESTQAMHMYCDFHVYEGITTCHHLRLKYKVIMSGIYKIRKNSGSNVLDLYCNLSSPRGWLKL